MVTCSFDELTVLHLLRGATWPAIQTGPVKTSLCFRNSSPNWQLERSCRSKQVSSFDKRSQDVNRTTGITAEAARCSWATFFEKLLYSCCTQPNWSTCRLNNHFCLWDSNFAGDGMRNVARKPSQTNMGLVATLTCPLCLWRPYSSDSSDGSCCL